MPCAGCFSKIMGIQVAAALASTEHNTSPHPAQPAIKAMHAYSTHNGDTIADRQDAATIRDDKLTVLMHMCWGHSSLGPFPQDGCKCEGLTRTLTGMPGLGGARMIICDRPGPGAGARSWPGWLRGWDTAPEAAGWPMGGMLRFAGSPPGMMPPPEGKEPGGRGCPPEGGRPGDC